MLLLMPRGFGAGMRGAVLREIQCDPAVRPSEIGVTAQDGLVILTGYVGSRGAKVAVERAVKRVPGVRSIANDLHVTSLGEQTDADIAREALHRLRNNRAVPFRVQAVVSDGFITLDGTVSAVHQRLAAEGAVKGIPGVKGIANDITLEAPQGSPLQAADERSSPWLV
jgi:osmotically-inducible protein OsmY